MANVGTSIRNRDYAEYLALYGSVYGITSETKRVQTIASLRRRDMMTYTAACRGIRLEIATRTDEQLHSDARTKEYQLSEACRPFRGDNIRRCDLQELRMIRNELSRREAGRPRIIDQDYLTHGRYIFA